MKDLDALKIELSSIRRGGRAGHKRPHKLIMLLAVIDLFEDNLLKDNCVYLDNNLTARFEQYFSQYKTEDDLCQPAPPFFHLRNSSFWHHKVLPGKEEEYKRTSTGGGRKRVDQLIEYSYLSDQAYQVMTDPTSRQELRRHLQLLLEKPGDELMKRIATVFHESFSLVRPAITQVLEVVSDAVDTGLRIDLSALRENSQLGANYVKAMPRYAVGTGLLNEKPYRLTELGKFIYEHDPSLNHPSTLWLMHYHLSAPTGPGPAFWHFLISQRVRPGITLERSELIEAVQNFIRESEGKELVDRSARTLISVFAGTYTKTDGLGRLGILEETDSGYQVLEPDPPNEWVVGYALAHYWDSVWPQFRQVALGELSQPGGFADLFFLGTFQLNSRLRELQSRGLLELVQIAPPHQILRLWRSPSDFLQYIYD